MALGREMKVLLVFFIVLIAAATAFAYGHAGASALVSARSLLTLRRNPRRCSCRAALSWESPGRCGVCLFEGACGQDACPRSRDPEDLRRGGARKDRKRRAQRRGTLRSIKRKESVMRKSLRGALALAALLPVAARAEPIGVSVESSTGGFSQTGTTFGYRLIDLDRSR